MKWAAGLVIVFSVLALLSARADDSCGNPPQPPCETNCDGSVTCYDPITGYPLPGEPVPPETCVTCETGSPSPTPQPDSGCSSCSGGANPFNPFSGSVGRNVTDMALATGQGTVKIAMKRSHASRWQGPGDAGPWGQVLGNGGNWRHGYDWQVFEYGTTNGQPMLRVYYPNGFYGNFKRGDGATNMTFLANTHERIRPDGTNFYLTFLSGANAHIVKHGPTTNDYRVSGFWDRYSNRYDFAYATGLLRRVSGPNTNDWLEFSYTNGSFATPPGNIQFSFTDATATQVSLRGTFHTNWGELPMTNSGSTWYITTNLAAGTYEYKFFSRYAGGTEAWYSDPENPFTDPADNNNSVALIAASGYDFSLLSRATMSDGRWCDYQYGFQLLTNFGNKLDQLLTNVAYGASGMNASYTYYGSQQDYGRRALLKTADDPMYSGAGRAVEYLYQTNAFGEVSNMVYSGQISEERHKDTGVSLGRLVIVSNTTIRYVVDADGRTNRITFTQQTGQPMTNEIAGLPAQTTRSEYFLVEGNEIGMRKAAIDPMGRRTDFARTQEFGAVTEASNSLRGVTRYYYSDTSAPFYLTNVADYAGRTNVYERDAAGRVTKHIYPDGLYDQFAYDSRCLLLTNRRTDATVWSYDYDANGRRTSATDPAGGITRYGYDSLGRLAWVSNQVGATTRYFYDWRGLTTNVVHPDNTAETTWYDRYGQMTQRIDRLGGKWVNTYNAYGHLTSAVDPAGATNRYAYSVGGLLLTNTTALGLSVTYQYDAMGRRTLATYSTDGTTDQWKYDPDGVRTQINRLGKARTFTYDTEGRLQKITDERTNSTSYGYDQYDNRVAVTNANGNALTSRFDSMGRLVAQFDCSDALVRSNAYDAFGRLQASYDGNLVATSNHYDSAGRIAAVFRAGLPMVSNVFDAAGRVTARTDASGMTTTNEYDAMNRIVKAYMPDGTFSQSIWSNGQLAVALDRAGRRTTYIRDVAGRVTSQIDNATNTVGYRYDMTGNMTNLVDQNGVVTKWAYDAEGRQVAKTYADNSVNTYGYDALGRLTNKLDAGVRLTGYGYDDAGNLTNIDYAADADVSFTYDNLNRRTKMVDGVGTTLWTYASDCLAETSADGPFASDAVQQGYDAARRLVSLTYAGITASNTLDALGRIVSVTGGGASNGFEFLNRSLLVTRQTRSNGVTTDSGYDGLRRLTNLVHRNGSTVLKSWTIANNNADERTAIAVAGIADAGRTVSYGYDPVSQLTSASGNFPGYDFQYAFDPAGNPVRQQRNGLVTSNSFNNLNQNTTSLWSGVTAVLGTANITNGSVTVNGTSAVLRTAPTLEGIFTATNLPVDAGLNEYTALLADPFGRVATSRVSVTAQNHGFGYDRYGNLTNDGTRAYVWDDADRLASVRALESGAELMRCRYDGLGRRVENVEAGATNRYVYSGPSAGSGWLVLAVLSASNTVAETYRHGPDLSGSLGGAGGIGGILSVTLATSNVTHTLHADFIGNIALACDSNAAVTAAIEYEPFGSVLAKSGSFNPRFQFSSKERDESAGLSYYGYRYYNPQLAHWLNRDSHHELSGHLLYAYLFNNSLSYYDDFGNEARKPPPRKDDRTIKEKLIDWAKALWAGLCTQAPAGSSEAAGALECVGELANALPNIKIQQAMQEALENGDYAEYDRLSKLFKEQNKCAIINCLKTNKPPCCPSPKDKDCP